VDLSLEYLEAPLRAEISALKREVTELQNQVTASRESEVRFQEFAATASDWLWETDSESRFTVVTDAYFEATGFRPEDVIGKTRRELRESYYANASSAELEGPDPITEAFDRRESFRDVLGEYPWPDGSTRYFLINGRPVYGADGEFQGHRGTAVDITESKQSELALEEREALLRSIIDHSPATISLKDLDGRYQLVNKAYLSAFDVTLEQAIGEFDESIITASHTKIRAPHEKSVIKTGEASTEERRGVLPSGTEFSGVVTKFPIRNQVGEIKSIGTIGTDLSALRKAEENLQAVESHFSEILRIAPQAIISMNVDGIILMFNDAAENTFGYRRNEVVGQSLHVLLPEYVRREHAGLVKSFVDGPDSVRFLSKRSEISGRRRDGSLFPAEASISKLQSEDQTILTVTMQDISERKQTHEDLRKALVEAERANQAKTEFLATMSHELRTPLNAIIGFSETMAGQYFGALGSEKYIEYAHDIGSSGEHLLNLINDLLDLSAIEAGKHQIQTTPLNFQEIILDCTPIAVEAMKRKGIVFVRKIPNNLPTFVADGRALKQVILNLLSNATKFTSKGGYITLSAKASMGVLEFKVRDTGLGVSKEKIANLTEPFVRGESDPYKSQEGTGLGLAIVKSLVELHGGDLVIESEIGVGTTVTVALPLSGPSSSWGHQ
jgi:PAS domain S-box-containing protein